MRQCTPHGSLEAHRRGEAIGEMEGPYIRAILCRTRGIRPRAAEVLELSHRALLYKIKEHGIGANAKGQRG